MMNTADIVRQYYRGNLEWLPRRTIVLTKHGSQAYGTSTPESDLDIKGIAVPPVDYHFGFLKKFEQAESKEPDMVIYDLRKFFFLAADNNPNILEILYTDESDWLIRTPMGEELVANRESFLSKRARFSFSGYAHAQMKRIQGHYRWLKNPPKAPPERSEFGLPERTVIPKDQLMAAESLIKRKLEEWDVDLEPLDPNARINLQNKLSEMISEITITADAKYQAAARAVGYDSNFIEILDRERAYRQKKADWDHYQTWEKERNPKRAALEAKFGYDCYSDDTEFLTSSGWKRFDDISCDDQLATVFVKNRHLKSGAALEHRAEDLGVEYQRPIDRFSGSYTGTMYHLVAQHTDVLVTPNHRMLFSKVERNTHKKYPISLEEAAFLPDTFEVLIAPAPKKKNYSNKHLFGAIPVKPDAYLALMGWYLSDGCMTFRDGSPKSVRISQRPDGKISWSMSRWHGDHGELANSSVYIYQKEPTSFCPRPSEEKILDVRDKYVVSKIAEECGSTKEKRIPRWIFGLSKRLMEKLFDSMAGGDGTERHHKTKSMSFIYYTSLKGLADDVQELAVMCGWESGLWGPYSYPDSRYPDKLMYQVHVRKDAGRLRRLSRSNNVSKIEVENQRIVCFTVPNGTLITRRNGKVGIHGNSKHAMHLVRLMKMCKEILQHHTVIVKRPDAEELLSIRNGAWTYEYLLEWAKKQEEEIEQLYKTSTLRHSPDRNALDRLCVDLVTKSQDL